MLWRNYCALLIIHAPNPQNDQLIPFVSSNMDIVSSVNGSWWYYLIFHLRKSYKTASSCCKIEIVSTFIPIILLNILPSSPKRLPILEVLHLIFPSLFNKVSFPSLRFMSKEHLLNEFFREQITCLLPPLKPPVFIWIMQFVFIGRDTKKLSCLLVYLEVSVSQWGKWNLFGPWT